MSSGNNSRIAKNTLMLYFRMLFSMGVSLYTSRVVLNILGIEDFGIYNVVGGLVAMFSLVSGSLSSASQRFITFELGKKEDQKLQEVFSTTVTVHLLLATIILLLAESVGLWFLNTQLNIASSRMNAANWVYQCSVFSFIVFIISIPYNATIIAHERMKAFAYIGIGEVLMRLGAVLALPFLPFDKLEVYAIFIMLIAIAVRLVYGHFCRKNFLECRFRIIRNYDLFKRIASFAGWNFIGTSSAVLMTQGVNILLNIFYNVIVNAAQGVASQVQNAISGFVNNFMMALNPQITKSYASGEYKYMITLVQQGARFSFYMIFLLSLPILIETESVLKLWLKIVPDYAVIFVRLSLIYAILQSLSNTLVTAMLATGDIKKYQFIVGGIQTLNFPFSYLALKFGLPPQSALIIAIVLSLFCFIARVWLLRSMIGLSAKYYLTKVFGNVIVVSICSMILPLLISFNMGKGLIGFFVVCITSVLSTSITMYYIGLSSKERISLNGKVNKYFKNLKYSTI